MCVWLCAHVCVCVFDCVCVCVISMCVQCSVCVWLCVHVCVQYVWLCVCVHACVFSVCGEGGTRRGEETPLCNLFDFFQLAIASFIFSIYAPYFLDFPFFNWL